MTIALQAPAGTLTYEEYMAESHVEGRYDIIEGVRSFMSGASWDHQEIAANVLELLRGFGRQTALGKAVAAPFDVLIRRRPKLQTRQPDVLFISQARLGQIGGPPKTGPLEVAPEMVVEIISDSETQRIIGDKIADYATIGVEECWVIRPVTRTVELLQPKQTGWSVVVVFDETQTLTSRVFPTLSVPVAEMFHS